MYHYIYAHGFFCHKQTLTHSILERLWPSVMVTVALRRLGDIKGAPLFPLLVGDFASDYCSICDCRRRVAASRSSISLLSFSVGRFLGSNKRNCLSSRVFMKKEVSIGILIPFLGVCTKGRIADVMSTGSALMSKLPPVSFSMSLKAC